MAAPGPAARPVREGLFTDDPEPRLLGVECHQCWARHFPRTDTCPYCGTPGPEPVELPPTGRLWAWTTVTTAPPGYEGPVPFGFGVVELDGGLRVIGRLTEADAGALTAGQPMRLVLTPVSPEGTPPVISWAFGPDAGDSR